LQRGILLLQRIVLGLQFLDTACSVNSGSLL
jgi:hypothetical protein